jgi:hypothetical protein
MGVGQRLAVAVPHVIAPRPTNSPSGRVYHWADALCFAT